MDRLSDLPDSLICHILSFLPTTFSAATSVLSKRWRYLWMDVPVLDLHYSSYSLGWGCRFSDIVYVVLMRHNHGDLHTFRLTTTDEYHRRYRFNKFNQFQIETWISTIAARGLRNLHISLNSTAYRIPRCLFVSKTLVDLSLHRCEIQNSTVRLPSLKKLHLVDVHFPVEERFSDLISGCPVLEGLVIDWTVDYLWLCKYFQYRLFSPTIKSIKIVSSKHPDYSDEETEALGCQYPLALDMDTPALEYLKIEGYVPKYISAQTQTSLVEADITVTVSEDQKKGETFSTISVLKFVDKLHNVGSLCLRLSVDHFTEVDDAAFATSTVWFHNLKKLELAADRRFLLKFLEFAPNLRVIIMQKVDKYLSYWELLGFQVDEYLNYCEESPQVHPCLTSHLTSIIIHEFEGTAHDLEMITYLLRNAKVLETMDIYFKAHDSFDDNKKRDAQKSISLFERGSPACKLRFG